MKGRSALPRRAFVLGLLAVAGGAAAVTWGRGLLARIDAFDARRIEVVGARWVAPDSVLHLAAIGRGRSVWDDFSQAEVRLASHPLIEDASVRRSGLRALRIVVREVEPLALVGVPDLRAVRDDGTLLPLDPTRTALDLPVLTQPAEVGEGRSLEAGPAREALRVFGRLRALDPGLAAVVSDFRLDPSGGLLAHLEDSQPVERMALPGEVDEQLVARIRATLGDLRSRGVDATMVEARYRDQIVVQVSRPQRQGGRRL